MKPVPGPAAYLATLTARFLEVLSGTGGSHPPEAIEPPRPKNSRKTRVWFWLEVPIAEKDEVKALGARWQREARKWYVPTDHPDPSPLLPWMAPALIAALPNTPRLALLLDGYHFIHAHNLQVFRHSDTFDDHLMTALLHTVNRIHLAGFQVGCIRFHHARPLDPSVFRYVDRDARLLGMDPAPIITHYKKAHYAVTALEERTHLHGIPFQAILGRTRYNGFQLNSRAIADLPRRTGGWQDILDALDLDVKQKTVDTAIVLDLLDLAELGQTATAPDGFMLVATDTDFTPAVARAGDKLQIYARERRRNGYIGWVGIGNEPCPYDATIPESCRLTVPRVRRKSP